MVVIMDVLMNMLVFKAKATGLPVEVDIGI